MKPYKKSAKKSFTLLEVMVSLGIFLLIIILIWGWQKDVFSINNLLIKKLVIQDNLRKTIKSFVAEARTAQPSAAGAYLLETANKDEIVFFSDLDYDGIVERVRYFLNDHKIKKGVIEPTGQPPVYNSNDEIVNQLADAVINQNDEIFLYYDESYDGDGDPLVQPVNISTVRLIKIIITADENTDQPPKPITETSQISIRNLKDNL